jgi:hypothetical protein
LLTSSKHNTDHAVAKQTDELKQEMVTQKDKMVELNEEIAWQGKTLSVFTWVATVFLPLGFFSQVSGPSSFPTFID